jgi:hypothetical protein
MPQPALVETAGMTLGEMSDYQPAGRLKAKALLRDGRIADLVEEVEGLQRLEHAAAIEQAKGVIMHTAHCGPDAAFAVLVARSQRKPLALASRRGACGIAGPPG